MSERFNFYDIYGYLLPGGLLLGLLWLPFGLLMGKWPPADWSSAILALGLAYIVGHILHALSEAAFPSKFRDKSGKKRQPSYLLVDKAEKESITSRYQVGNLDYLAKQINDKFGIQIEVNSPWTKELEGRRSAAFFKCRSFLIEKKAVSYAEQQQGMYALMRGVGAAFTLACALYAGVAIGALLCTSISNGWMFPIFLILLSLMFFATLYSLLPKYEEAARRSSFWILVMVLLCVGVITAKATKGVNISFTSLPSKLEISLQSEEDPVKFHEKELALFRVRQAIQIHKYRAELMLTLAAITAVLVPLSLSAFKAFAANFAATIYRDFSTYAPSPTVDDIRSRANQIYEKESSPNGKADEHLKQAKEQLGG